MQEDSGSAPTFFREHKEFFVSLDKAAQSASNAGSWDSDNAPEEEARLIREMCSTLELYQEQPTCLDPYIERIVSQLMRVIQNHTDAFHDSVMDAEESRAAGSEAHARAISTSRLSGVFDMVYTLCKVRGYKVVLRFFPHQVANVEPVFVMLWHHAATFDTNGWTARYVLLIWLSLLAMIPFDIESMDSGLASLPDLKPADAAVVGPGGSLIERWVGLGRLYLRRPGCEMEGAAVMLSRLLSRKDTVSSLQPAFLEWAIGEVSEVVSSESHEATSSKKGISIGGVLRINGALRVLCHLLLAMDSRGALDKHIAPLMDIFHSDAFEQNSLTRKLIAKAAQRLALLSLPPPAAAAASGGARGSAVANLRGDVSDAGKGGAEHGMDDDGIVDGALGAEVPEDVEGFVGILLHKLHDRDTIVRWSAAKGVGRISERLPAALAHEIASAVADILKDEALVLADGTIDVSMTSEFSWHGALLCLAELARRGLLAQQALREVVPWIIRGLTYEIQRGDYSVGSNVRDAACYTMWSFARVHRQSSRQVFNEMRMQMATALVSVAVFDREANVRRAASAAFQEHVGRHDSFPHGIPVLQLADFFSVGNMRNAFVAASRRIVEFAEYREPLLRHLCTTTIYHWDLKTRELAAEALRELAPVAAEYVITALLPDIVRNTQSPFLAVRHGAIVATGVIAETLASHLRGNGEVSKNVLSVATAIPQRYLDDFGASLTLSALARYMGSLSRARWDLGGDAAQSTYFDLFVQAFTSCTNQNALVPEFTAFADGFGITAEQREM
ncbi:ARM repeat-containing protein [Martensiomyces pterosporus]|nr:ARM repeat-containing protein [Martensiomyces pterosporus]